MLDNPLRDMPVKSPSRHIHAKIAGTKKVHNIIQNSLQKYLDPKYLFWTLYCISHLSIHLAFLSIWISYRDSSKGCCTTSNRGWRNLARCVGPAFIASSTNSLDLFSIFSRIFFSNTNTETSWKLQNTCTVYNIMYSYQLLNNMYW